VNFAEAHNDHLQLLAETGLPTYFALMAAIMLVGSISLSPRPVLMPDNREEIARVLALPLAILLIVVMSAQFALQLAAPACTFVLLGAVCVAWSGDDAA
jgi:O-antigen ligase